LVTCSTRVLTAASSTPEFSAGPEIVKEFERRLRVSDLVIKFLTVRIDETLKRVEKRRKEREKRAHRKPQMAAPAPAAPLERQMMGEGTPAPAMPGQPKEAQ
jgi:small subunit ribosomal protein S6